MDRDIPIKKLITTLKVSGVTKKKIDQLRVYPRESYDEVITRILMILNTCRTEPERARSRLIILDKERKRNLALTNSTKLREELHEKEF